MKCNTLKRNLPFILLCSIVTTSITIPSVAKAQQISTADIAQANQIVLKTKKALKNFFYSADVKAIKDWMVYLEKTNPCGEISDETLQLMRDCCKQLIPILKKAGNISYAKKHLGPVLEKIVNQIEDFANQLKDSPKLKSLENVLRRTPIEIQKIIATTGTYGKIKMIMALNKATW